MEVIEATVNVRFRCRQCGTELDSYQRQIEGELWIQLDPCHACLDEAKDEGFTEGENSVDVTH